MTTITTPASTHVRRRPWPRAGWRAGALAALTALTLLAAPVGAAQAATFTTDTRITVPGASAAVSRAASYVGKASSLCSDGCRNQSLRVAARIWGWGYTSAGFTTANAHWTYLAGIKRTRPGSYTVPVGGVLFWGTGSYGVEAVYVGGGNVVLPWRDAAGRWNIRKVPAATVTAALGGYRGWAYPVYTGTRA